MRSPAHLGPGISNCDAVPSAFRIELREGSDEFNIDLTAWMDAPNVHELVGPIREVHGANGDERL